MKITKILITAFAASCGLAVAQTPYTNYEKGREAYYNYRFGEANRYFSQAKQKLPKDNHELSVELTKSIRQATLGESFLNRVEQIVIIDSISADREEFFNTYRLPQSAGTLGGESALPYPEQYVDYVYTNERNDYKLWSTRDSIGNYRPVESVRLTDGSWSEPEPLFNSDVAITGDVIYPYMMPDGVTLYFANNGDNSMGGFDIMVATRDAGTGKFLQPSNIGFPYNSPHNDYLLVIDELNGVGWWATDRNSADGEVTVYLFIPNEIRKNLDTDEKDAIEYARISDWRATQEGEDYTDLLNQIESIQPAEQEAKAEFSLYGSDGRHYTRYSQLPTPEARSRAKQYFYEKERLSTAEEQLDRLRVRYGEQPSDSQKRTLQSMERDIRRQRNDTEQARQEMWKAILSHK